MTDKNKTGSFKEIFTRDFLLISVINLMMFFSFQMTTIGMPVYVSSLGAPSQVIGLVTSFITISATVVRVFAGALLDRFGRKGALVGGCAIIACSVVSYAIFPIVGIILGLRLLQGIGWGMGTTASSTIAADVVPKRRFAEGMGYFAMTSAIAGALAPALALELAGNSGAFTMILVAAGFTIVTLVLSFFQSGGAKKEKPQRKADVQGEASSAETASAPRRRGIVAWLNTVFERQAVVPGMLMFLVNIGFGSITTFVAIHAANQGIPSASIYFVFYALTSIASRPGFGRLIDRRGFRGPALISAVCSVITLVLLGLANSMWMLAIAGIFAGLGNGTAMGVYQTMAVASVGHERHGVAMSTFLVFFDLGIAIGALGAGMIAEAYGYTVMFLVLTVFPMLACIISLFVVKKGQADYARG